MFKQPGKAFIAALLFLPWVALSQALSYNDFDLLESHDSYDILSARGWDDSGPLLARRYYM